MARTRSASPWTETAQSASLHPPHRSSPSPIFCLCSAALTPLAIRDRAAPGLTDHEKYLFDIHGVSTRAIPTVP